MHTEEQTPEEMMRLSGAGPTDLLSTSAEEDLNIHTYCPVYLESTFYL